jgi:hypothetical protein
MAMFYFQFEARPKRTHKEYGQIGGAIVICWVRRRFKAEAEKAARDSIAESRWRTIRMDCGFRTTRAEQNRKTMKHFKQAEATGEFCVYYTWPSGAGDDERAA